MKHIHIQTVRACRSCLNKTYGLRLDREDCLYYFYPAQCSLCGKMCNIVTNVRLTRKWKLWIRCRNEEKKVK